MIYNYAICAAILLSMYLLGYTQNPLFNAVLFLSVIVLNRMLNVFQKNSDRYKKIMYATEILFLMFLLLLVFLHDNYFMQYKLLMIPSLLLSLVQSFGLKVVKK